MKPKTMAKILKQAMPHYGPFCQLFPDKSEDSYSYLMCETLLFMADHNTLSEKKAQGAIFIVECLISPTAALYEYLKHMGCLYSKSDFGSNLHAHKALQFWAYHIARWTKASKPTIQSLGLALYNNSTLHRWNAEELLPLLTDD